MYRDVMNSKLLNGLREYLREMDRKHDARFTGVDRSTQNLAQALLGLQDILEDVRTTKTLLVTPATAPHPSPTHEWTEELSSLHLAAREGDLQSLCKQLRHPVTNVHITDREGASALHVAKTERIAEKLLKCSAKLFDEKTIEGRTPLHIAMLDRRLGVVKFLLSRKAHKTTKDIYDKTALDYASNFPPVSFMLKYGHETECVARDHLDNTDLFHMTWLCDMEGLQFYLSQGGKIDARNKLDETGLTESCRHGDLEVVRLLLDKNANIEAKLRVNDFRPLTLSVTTNRPQVVSELLARGADPEAKLGSGRTAISEAAFKSYWEIVRILVNAGCRISAQYENGCPPIYFAVEAGELSVLKFLTDRCSQSDINIQDNQGNKSLLTAVSNGKDEMVKTLLRARADPLICNDLGYTPLVKAARLNRIEAMKMLLAYNTNPSRAADPTRRYVGSWAPIHQACMQLNIRNNENQIPLHFAVRDQECKAEIVRLLLEHKGWKDAVSLDGSTPLADACQFSNFEVVQALLDSKYGADAVWQDANT